MARKDRDMPDGARTPASFSTVDEQTKAQAMRAAAPEVAIDDSYFTKVVSGGKTQAQLDALANARTTAATIRDTSTTMSSRVDPVTGKVITTPKGTIGLGTGGTGGVTGGTGGATTYTASDGTKFTDAQAYSTYQASLNLKATAATTAAQEAARVAEEKRRQGQSAYALLFSEFERYGMGALVEPLKQFIQDGISPSEFTLRLRETDAYKKRFAANAQRIAKGLRALSEAEYITMEDQYQNVMRQYGLPDTYYTRGEMGRQEGFEKFIAGDVSAVELEDRISTAQKRVLNANPEVTQALKQFYPDITNADILAYTLDPKNAIENIKRKVTTAEIGGAALQAGLQTGVNRADVLRAAGVTKESAQQGFGTIAGGLQRGSQLASIYGEDPYTQTTAEQEVFNIAGAQEARKQRQKITGLEKAAFGGQTGLTSGALARDRAGGY
jgi:hypothetical protein